jgi:uncharacterized protein YndB with AHSA1/START domain
MTRIDEAQRLIEATPEAIFAAMTEADALVRWLPPSGMHGEVLEFDPRPGGLYRMVLRYDDKTTAGKSGGSTDEVSVRYTDLVAGALVAQEVDFISDDPQFAGTMTMNWIIEDRPEGALVIIRAHNVPEGIDAADHQEGLRSSLENLARYVEDTPTPTRP